MSFSRIILKPGKESSLERFHPWVFSGAVANADGELTEGDWVEVYSSKKKFLGAGFCQEEGIVAKILTFTQQSPDIDFWKEKLQKALSLRLEVGLVNNKNTNAYRWINGEGDGLPGMILDVYGATVVFQAHSIGMFLHRKEIAEAIQSVFPGKLKAIYNKSETTLPSAFEDSEKHGFLFGKKSDTGILENGCKFSIDIENGQKTGFFLDQRDNRQLLGKYAIGKSVLNTFCYTGGFSIYALKNGAASVDSIDVSAPAMGLVKANIELNGLEKSEHQEFIGEALPFLKDNPGKYDLIILDPPAFAKSFTKRHNAVQGYKRLNVEGIKSIKPGGIIFTFSCSQVVDRQLFEDTIRAAAIEAGRNIRIIHQLSQPADHPVSIFHPEGGYLKGLALWVE